MSTADDLSRRLANVTAKTAGQRERLAEVMARIEGGEDDAPQCGFYARNPFTDNLGQCISPAETAVIVAVTAPDGTFRGDGARVEACRRHADELERTYKAAAVPAESAEAGWTL